MKLISPYTVMLTINMKPIYGIVLACMILGLSEKMSEGFYIDALIIFSYCAGQRDFKEFIEKKWLSRAG